MEAIHLQIMSVEAYRNIDGDGSSKYELIDGRLYMQAAPNHRHQRVQQILSSELYLYLKGKSCQVITDAELGIKEDIVIPDIMVYCDKDFVGQTYTGIPLVVAEILSDSTRFVDYNKKMRLYELHGIQEYWIVNPKLKSVTINKFSKSEALDYMIGETVVSDILSDFMIDVEVLFA